MASRSRIVVSIIHLAHRGLRVGMEPPCCKVVVDLSAICRRDGMKVWLDWGVFEMGSSVQTKEDEERRKRGETDLKDLGRDRR